MIKLYYYLVKAELRTIDQVPETFQAGVQALIDADTAS
jgi:hypothetical protein